MMAAGVDALKAGLWFFGCGDEGGPLFESGQGVCMKEVVGAFRARGFGVDKGHSSMYMLECGLCGERG